MSSLSPIKARDLIKILNKIGFIERRQKGSHLFLSHRDGRTTVVPSILVNKLVLDFSVQLSVMLKLSSEEF